MELTSTSRTTSFTPDMSAAPHWPNGVRRFTLAAGAAATRAFCAFADIGRRSDDEPLTERAKGFVARHNWPHRPIRIAFLNPGPWARALADAAHGTNIEFCAPADTSQPGPLFADHSIDVIIAREHDGSLRLTTPEHVGHDAAWFEWSSPRPLTFPNVFPGRLDAAALTLAARPGTPAPMLVRMIAETLGLLARHPNRLMLDDVLAGRYLPDLTDPRLLIAPLIPAMVHRLDPATPTSADAPLARILGAALATGQELDNTTRRQCMDRLALLMPSDPETLLRQVAVRFACEDFSGGLDSLQRASAALAAAGVTDLSGQTAFVQGELETGVGLPAFGRIAAGICMLNAGKDSTRHAYFRDDLLDDLEHSPALANLPLDRRIFSDIFAAVAPGKGVAISAPSSAATPAAKPRRAATRKPKAPAPGPALTPALNKLRPAEAKFAEAKPSEAKPKPRRSPRKAA